MLSWTSIPFSRGEFVWKFALIVMAMTAIPIGQLIGRVITDHIEAPRRAFMAESERKLAADLAVAEAKAAAEKLERDRKFAILEKRVQQIRSEYAKAVRENKPDRAGELFAEVISYMPRPTMTRQEAIDAAREDCLRIKVYQQLEAAAFLRQDWDTALTIHEVIRQCIGE